MLAAGCLYLALPESLAAGPRWLLLAIVVALVIPMEVTFRNGRDEITRV